MSVLQTAMETVVQAAARLMPEKAPDPLLRKAGAVGAQLSRVDGPLKVAGKARFAAEVPLDDLAYAALAYSTIARGKITSIDIAAAEAAPGVVLVMTHENAPRMKAPIPFTQDMDNGAAVSDLPVMQDALVRWNGQPVAVVLAETQEQADHAATLVAVVYEPEPARLAFDELKRGAEPPTHILGEPASLEVGDAEAALRSAPFSVDITCRTPRHNHGAIEPHAATVLWEGDRLTVHDATQMLGGTRATLAHVFGLEPGQVRVLSPFVGGGFGNKALWDHQILAVAAARLAGRPVRMALSREGVFRVTGGRTTTEQRVALGAKADGTLAALIHTGVAANGAHNLWPEQFTFPARHLYAADAIKVAQEVLSLDMVANCAMRAPGESVGTFALETALDELAERMGLDPVELRRRIEPGKDPTTGRAFSSRNLLQAYATGAERFGWRERGATPRARREGEWLVGMGVATAIYPYYRMPGGAASIRLAADGRAVVRAATHEMGMGTATAQTQHAADRLGVPVEAVTFEYGDSDLPRSTMAGGSSQTVSVVAAVAAASEALVKELLRLAGNDSPLAGLKPDEVEARDGGLCRRDEPERFEGYASILARAGRGHVEVEASAPAPVEMQTYSMYSYGAQFCEVRVSEVTGEVRVSRFLGSFDTGRIVNPKTARSQFRGGIIMGLGLALTEETLFDERTGRIMNPSLAEYHLPVHLDVPEIEVIWTDIPDPHAPLGIHGIGEIGITGVGAAVANAVHNATGKRIRELPITLDKVLTA